MPSRPAQCRAHPMRTRLSWTDKWRGVLGMVFACLAVAAALAGCAGQVAYHEGKDLVEKGQVEEGLNKFQQAIEQDPRNVVYKQAYLQTRERAVYRFLQEADGRAADGKDDDAKKLYRRVLEIDPDNDRAKAGLDALDRDRRHAGLLKEAQAALEKKDIESSNLKLSAILTEDPHNGAARTMQRSLAPKTLPPTADAALAAAYKKPITIEFKDVALKQIFEVISRSSGLNFLFDKDVKTDQKTSIFLKNSTIEQAVHFTLLTNQLEQQVLDANTVLIYPNTPAKQKDYQEMVVKSFFLANAEAKTVANTLKTITKIRDIVVDDKLNMLIVRDTPDAIKLADKLIALQDMPEPEVMMEVEILEVNRTRLTDLGIQWPSSLSLAPIPSATGGTLTLDDLLHLNRTSISGGSPSVTINAGSQVGDAKILANPRIRARNHEKAKIVIGERVPNITVTTSPFATNGYLSESINYVDVGLKLEVEPTIYLDNDVAIKVSLEVSNIVSQVQTKAGSLAYDIGTRDASTVLRLKDGENQVLAGLINDEDRKSANQIPGLGSIPVLGRLFGSTNNNNVKTEIVLSITPHVVRNIRRPDAVLAEFRSGTDSSFHVRPDSVSAMPATSVPAENPPPLAAQPDNEAGGPGNGGFGNTGGDMNRSSPNGGMGSGTPSADNSLNGGNPSQIGNPIIGGGTQPQGVQFQWQGPTQAKVGDTVTLQLSMQSDQPVSSIPLTLGFDNKVLQVIGIAEGDFMKQGGAQTAFTSRVDPNGQIQLTDTRSGSSGASAPGTVATISFHVLAPADQTQVQMLNMAPMGPAGTMVSASAPPPFTLQAQQ